MKTLTKIFTTINVLILFSSGLLADNILNQAMENNLTTVYLNENVFVDSDLPELSTNFTIEGNNYNIYTTDCSGIVIDEDLVLNVKNVKAINNFYDTFITNCGGTVNLYADTTDVTFDNNAYAINNLSGTINLYAKDNYKIIFNDKIVVDRPRGVPVNLNNTININPNGQDGTIVLNANMEDYSGKINFYSGTTQIGNDGTWFNNASDTIVSLATIDATNNKIQTIKFKNLAITNTLYLNVDVDLANSSMDTIVADSVSKSGKITIKDFNLLSDKENSQTTITFTKSQNLYDKITLDVSTVNSDNYTYDVVYNGDGTITFANGVGQIQQIQKVELNLTQMAMVGGYIMQSNVMNQTLSMVGRSRSDKMLKTGFWITPFAMKEDVTISNTGIDTTSYGLLAGFDFKVAKDKKITIYGGSTASKQEKDELKVDQNGYVVGATATLSKENFYVALTGNVGTSKVNIEDDTNTDEFDMLMYSVGVKSGYNIDLGKSFSLEPTLLAWYGRTDSDKYNSKRLHKEVSSRQWNNLQIEPIVKAEMNLYELLNPYLFVGYAFNLGDKISEKDNELDEMGENGYFEYGIGLNKDFVDNFSLSLQVTGRNGDRNGIGANIGFKYAF